MSATGLVVCSVCLCSNAYMAKHTRQRWLKRAAIAAATLCGIGIILNGALLVYGFAGSEAA